MKYMLDTNILIYLLKNQYKSVELHMRHVPSGDIVIPSVVIAELEFGAQNSNHYEKSIKVIRRLVNEFEVANFEKEDAFYYGKVRAELKRQGKMIGANDLLIGAMSLRRDMILVTHNKKEFSRIEGLMIEDWTE